MEVEVAVELELIAHAGANKVVGARAAAAQGEQGVGGVHQSGEVGVGAEIDRRAGGQAVEGTIEGFAGVVNRSVAAEGRRGRAAKEVEAHGMIGRILGKVENVAAGPLELPGGGHVKVDVAVNIDRFGQGIDDP